MMICILNLQPILLQSILRVMISQIQGKTLKRHTNLNTQEKVIFEVDICSLSLTVQDPQTVPVLLVTIQKGWHVKNGL